MRGGAQLAVLPGPTHMQITRRANVLLPILSCQETIRSALDR